MNEMDKLIESINTFKEIEDFGEYIEELDGKSKK